MAQTREFSLFGGTLFLLHVTSCFVTVIVVIMDTKNARKANLLHKNLESSDNLTIFAKQRE